MSPEQQPIGNINLSATMHFMKLRSDSMEFVNAGRYVDALNQQKGLLPHMANVVYPAADILEPREDGQVVDPDKKASAALRAGGLLASVVIDSAGGGQILENLQLPFSTSIPADRLPIDTLSRRRTELWRVGQHGYRDTSLRGYQELILAWEDDIAAPAHQPYVRTGFGLLMYFASKAIRSKHQNDMKSLQKEIETLETRSDADWLAEYKAAFPLDKPEGE